MAIATFIHDGSSVDYTPASDVAAGDVVVQNDLVGVAKQPIAAGALGALTAGAPLIGRIPNRGVAVIGKMA